MATLACAFAAAGESAGPSPEHAEAPSTAHSVIEPALLRELIVWAAEHRDRRLPLPGEAPALDALPADELLRVVCHGRAPEACRGLVAAYEPARRRIVYLATLDMRQHFDRSFIVHELVHWLQHRDGLAQAEAPCRAVAAAEREAYAAQNRYLYHHRIGRRVGGMLKFMACPTDDEGPVAR